MQYVISAANAKDYTTGMGNTFNLTLVLYALNTSVRYIYVSRHPILFFFYILLVEPELKAVPHISMVTTCSRPAARETDAVQVEC